MLLAIAALASVTVMAPAHATITTFEAFSEGCSGGGRNCGTFPLIPTGGATKAHKALSDGTIDVSASTSGGLPISACLPAACPPGTYHAEALGEVWTNVDVPAGTSSVHILVTYRLDESTADTEATLGNPAAISSGVLAAGAAQASCPGGGSIAGGVLRLIGLESPLGVQTMQTTIHCGGQPLPALTIHVGLGLAVQATSDGGDAHAAGRAQLLSVEIT